MKTASVDSPWQPGCQPRVEEQLPHWDSFSFKSKTRNSAKTTVTLLLACLRIELLDLPLKGATFEWAFQRRSA